MGFATGGTERMRLTSAGDLLVKLTSESAWTNTAGFATRSTGSTTITRSSAQPLLVNRLSTDGDIAVFYKDGAPVGSIGSYGGGTRLYAGSGSTGLGYFNSDSSIAPMNPSTQSNRDAAIDLGDSANRFKDLYLSGTAYINGITVGRGAGAVSTNTAVGYQAGHSNTTGNQLTAVGYQAAYTTATAVNITAIGYQAAQSATGDGTVAVGTSAAFASTGADNTAMGAAALLTNSSGAFNTAIGRSALRFNTTASNNTAVGYQAGYTATVSALNTFIGYQAGYTHNLGSAGNGLNLAIGATSGFALTTGASNTFVGGYGSGGAVTTGSKNSILGNYNGNQGGLDIRTSSNYIVLSDGDGNPRGIFDGSGNLLVGTTTTGDLGVTNQGVLIRDGFIQVAQTGTGTNTLVRFYNGNGQVGTITTNASATAYNTSSDYRLKEDWVAVADASTRVNALKPVNFAWKADGSRVDGFLAHELAEVVPEAVTGEKDAVDAEGNPEYQGIDQSKLVPLLTAALQEALAKIESLTARVSALEGN
jgi:hypothetical protein